MKSVFTFINTIQNRLLIFVFILTSVVFLISYCCDIERTFLIVTEIASFIGISIIAKFIVKERVDPLDKPIKTFDIKLINRHGLIDEAFSINKQTIVISGESGCGKSTLVKKFLEVDPDNVFFKDGNYYEPFSVPLTAKIAIFDQFEKAAQYSEYNDYISGINDMKNRIKFIVVVRKEFAGELIKRLNAKLVYITNDDVSEDSITAYFQQFSEESVKNHPVIERIRTDFAENKITFIHLNILSKMLKDDDYNFEAGDKYDEFLQDYLKTVLYRSHQPEALMDILYLLSLGFRDNTTLSFADFQNATLSKSERVENAVEYLISTGWVREVNSSNAGQSEKRYQIAHDYYDLLLQRICTEDMNPQICSNIGRYYLKQKERSSAAQKKSYREAVKGRCEKLHKERTVLNIALYIFLILSFAIDIVVFINTSLLENPLAIQMALLQIAIGISTIYVYNFHFHFMTVLPKKYWYGIVAGFILCLVSLYFSQLWGIILGAEVMIMGSVFWMVYKNYKDSYFFTHGTHYLVMGLVIGFLGWLYKDFIHGNTGYIVVFFLLYIAFISVTVAAHINENYMKEVIGRVIYEKIG